MTTLEVKSQINLESALLLTGKEETCLSSVHCAYYSCFQLILFYLDTKFSYDEEKRKREYDQYKKKFTGRRLLGSHEYWINKFANELKGQNQATNAAIIDSNIRKLKEVRVEADYQQTDFTKRQTDAIYDNALYTINLIKKSF